MTVEELIAQVDNLWCPSPLTLVDKVALLNSCQGFLYRKLDNVEAQAIVPTVLNTATYTLASAVQNDRIRHVVYYDASANEVEYNFTRFVVGTPSDNTYSLVTGTTLKVWPAPSVTGGTVASITITNAGSSFTTAPTVTVSGGGGSGCTATATINDDGEVDTITVDEEGSGFTSLPAIGFSGGGGSGATAAAVLGDIFRITYASKPTTIATTDLSVSPWGPSDYHMFYTWRLAELAAKANRDAPLANGFKADGDEVLTNLLRDFSTSPDSGFTVKAVW